MSEPSYVRDLLEGAVGFFLNKVESKSFLTLTEGAFDTLSEGSSLRIGENGSLDLFFKENTVKGVDDHTPIRKTRFEVEVKKRIMLTFTKTPDV